MMKKKDDRIEDGLEKYAKEYNVSTKGPLSAALVLTRAAKSKERPYQDKQFLTVEGGQVAGLGRAAVQSILKEYGIKETLAEEGGRTSRGNMRRMQGYIRLLNDFHHFGILDLNRIEAWWVERVKKHFTSLPLKLKNDQAKSLTQLVKDLMSAAYKRQHAQKGTMVSGAVMQHLVGAKLEIALPHEKIVHRGFSVADEQRGDPGDFVIGDCVIHVTTAPNEALIRKCQKNLDSNLRPLIITSEEGLGGAKALAKNSDTAERIELFEISQFIALNVYEWGNFKAASRPIKISDLVESYNKIIESTETDLSLKISLG